MKTEILYLIREYGSLIIFCGTLIDFSGIPLFIVGAGLFYSIEELPLWSGLTAGLLALNISDVILIFIGKYFNKNLNEKFALSQFSKFNKNLLIKGSDLFLSNQLVFYVFSKLIPVIGKYVPVFAGYTGKKVWQASLRFLIGDIIYCIFFFVCGFLFGDFMFNKSRLIGILSLISFLVVYFIFYSILNVKVKKKL